MALEPEQAARALLRLAESTNTTGEAYFAGLVRGLADVLSVRWVFLSRLNPEHPNRLQVVAGWGDGGPVEPIEYDLADTPCSEVLSGAECFFPTGVAARFPRDQMLVDLGVEAYAGARLIGPDGRARGLLTVMHDRPLESSPCMILELVAGRAAAELERTLVEARLRHREETIRFLTESTPGILWRATADDGRCDYLSARAAEYCGRPLASLLGFGILDYVHADDVAPMLRLWRHARETGEPFEAEYRLRRADGVYRWQFTRALPQRDADGAIRSWHGSVLDVDERRRAEDALRDADRRKDEFLAILAHELRNPLAPIRHALDTQAATDDRGEAREMREIISRQVQHLARLVDDLLDVARVTTGHIALRREAIDLRDIVNDALQTCCETFAAKSHNIVTRISPVELIVDGDRVRLSQIVTNILNNAAKFTDNGGEIAVEVDRTGEMIEIRVRDNGIGISEPMLPRIFDLFCQSDQPVDRPQGGLGVGLTLARRLVELHGGTLTVSSAGTGLGSEFRIALPGHSAAVGRREPEPAVQSISPPSLRILVVDDYPDMARALERLLSVMGHVVRVAHDGQAAIVAAHQLRPDVILLDIGLPQMNGFAVARHLRSLPMFDATRIIAMTGYSADTTRESVRSAGIDAHLIKPVDADELQAAIYALSMSR